jgi:hypothetical protein
MTKKFRTETMSITPALAQMWLNKNTNNRNMRIDVAHRYARDMAEGRWYLSHQGIAFYEDGTLADGQHRLHAVTIYNKPVTFVVTHGVPRAAGQMIDQHTPRMAHDAIRIAGGEVWINRDVVAVARIVMNHLGTDVHPKTVSELHSFIERYAEPLQFAGSLAPQHRRHLTTAPIRANYFCAEQGGESRDKLTRFADIMIHGEITGPSENAAIRLREYLLQAGGAAWQGAAKIETSRKIQRAIYLFCRGQSVTRLMMPEKLTYPIPQ